MAQTPQKGQKRKQVRVACTNCAASHAACSPHRPCARCIQRGMECSDRPRKRKCTSDEATADGSEGKVNVLESKGEREIFSPNTSVYDQQAIYYGYHNPHQPSTFGHELPPISCLSMELSNTTKTKYNFPKETTRFEPFFINPHFSLQPLLNDDYDKKHEVADFVPRSPIAKVSPLTLPSIQISDKVRITCKYKDIVKPLKVGRNIKVPELKKLIKERLKIMDEVDHLELKYTGAKTVFGDYLIIKIEDQDDLEDFFEVSQHIIEVQDKQHDIKREDSKTYDVKLKEDITSVDN